MTDGPEMNDPCAQVKEDLASALRYLVANPLPGPMPETLSEQMAREVYTMVFGTAEADAEFGPPPPEPADAPPLVHVRARTDELNKLLLDGASEPVA